MDRTETFLVWANPESPWSPWVKPVLFAFEYDDPSSTTLAPAVDLDWLPAGDPSLALIVDLPGAEGVALGMALARRGYRPIPLYNAFPGPLEGDVVRRAAVEVLPIAAQLRAAMDALRALPLAADAPPAFLLDANRRRSRFALGPGDFDNRSVCFPTDFPSPERLLEGGIRRAIVIQRDERPDVDLARVLAAWESAGIALLRYDHARAAGPESMHAPAPRWWRSLWYALTVTLGLRRSALGGFGATVHSTGG